MFLERYLQGQGPLFMVVVLGVAVVVAFVAYALSVLLVKVAMKDHPRWAEATVLRREGKAVLQAWELPAARCGALDS